MTLLDECIETQTIFNHSTFNQIQFSQRENQTHIESS